MSVEFDESRGFPKLRPELTENSSYGFSNLAEKPPEGLAGWFVRQGIAGDEAQARAFFLVIIMINFSIVIYVFSRYF